ncbi:hypothetical protein HF072_07285 [Bacillus sp. RO3]|nr:hypothetical protein [Bacillus sp. RO3]
MGRLFNSMQRVYHHQSNHLLDELGQAGITENNEGVSIHELDYHQLRHLLATTRIKKGI